MYYTGCVKVVPGTNVFHKKSETEGWDVLAIQRDFPLVFLYVCLTLATCIRFTGQQ